MDGQALETSQAGAEGEFRAGTDSAEKVAELRMLVKERLMCKPEARFYCDDAALHMGASCTGREGGKGAHLPHGGARQAPGISCVHIHMFFSRARAALCLPVKSIRCQDRVHIP